MLCGRSGRRLAASEHRGGQLHDDVPDRPTLESAGDAAALILTERRNVGAH